ncbi:hypothetical protein IWQ51_001738 [Labrenzia sp. EL_142]|nr:hypothetical protein [Labrenzia sp. EL_142]
MSTQFCSVVVAMTMLSGCCLNTYSDDPINLFNSKEKSAFFAQIDGEKLSLNKNVEPVVVESLQVWINYEVSGGSISATGRETAAVFVNGKRVTHIPYRNESGFKSTGKIELVPWMRQGLNSVEIVITHGVKDGITLSGARRAQAMPFGGLAHQCFAGKDSAKETITAFQVDYQPSDTL